MRTILIADDKTTSRELVRTVLEDMGYLVLEDMGYLVLEAADGNEALQHARAAHPDLLLLDLHMPHCDGYDVVRQLRRSAEFDATPIVALTASAMYGDRERAMAAGFTAYVAKPIGLSALRTEINKLLPGNSAV